MSQPTFPCASGRVVRDQRGELFILNLRLQLRTTQLLPLRALRQLESVV
jgi:hypothetical protein